MHDIWTLQGVGLSAENYPIIGDPDWAGDETLDPGRTLLTEKHQGAFAETLVVPARNVVPKPAELSMTQAAVMGTAWLTAYRMLFTKSGLRPGQRMLVQGASGGVSTALIQLGCAAGFTVWVTGGSAEKLALAERLGAHAVFATGERLPAKVDVVFDSVGQATWGHSMRALRPGGAIVCCGSTSGPAPSADLQRLFFLQLRVEGSTMGTRQDLVDLLAFVALAGIVPEVGMEIPIADAREGFEAMVESRTAGKVAFTV